ncbi:glycosyl hydrolase family 28-related protein [Cytobacillus massiliigabonensis]|uniref:glycosyl hydrolase family 28-related protein n=1 Tax=Cytobacillus massiliigabonensis TaxID=1871011 RepID=UPI000C822BBB|nr:glycosyl hydrolase family 28-related protein [Cytobacillus massiliigabonensis]
MNRRKVIVSSMAVFILFIVFIIQKEETNMADNTDTDEWVPDDSYLRENGINVVEYGVKGDGIADDTVNFQRAIDHAAENNKILIVPAKTYLVSPLKYRDSTSSDWWCLSIPSDAKIYFEPGALLKLVDHAPQKTRVLVISEVSNVNIYGRVEVDGSAHTVVNGNEHMHGIFIYDAKRIFIESAYAYNTYGDNLFVGGTEENYSEFVTINYFKGVKAGRKNVVIHYVDQLHIGTAILDNSAGGVDGNWTGENSLDLEPDGYKGKKKFYQRIDYLSTYGKGNDFTVGTKRELADKWILEIDQFNVSIMEGTSGGLQSYASTLKIGKLFMKSSANNGDNDLDLSYSANWTIDEAYFLNGKGYVISAKEQRKEKPNLKIRKLFISKPDGKGLELWGADASIEYLEANTIQGEVLNVFATNKQHVSIENMVTRNSGRKELIAISDYGFQPTVNIENLLVSDDRLKKVEHILYLKTQKAADGVYIANIQNYNRLNMLSFGPAVKRKEADIQKGDGS